MCLNQPHSHQIEAKFEDLARLIAHLRDEHKMLLKMRTLLLLQVDRLGKVVFTNPHQTSNLDVQKKLIRHLIVYNIRSRSICEIDTKPK